MNKTLRQLVVLAPIVLMGATACEGGQDEPVRSVRVPKEQRPVAGPADESAAMMAAAPGAAQQIQWTTPAGWEQLPGDQMRVASFRVSKDNPQVLLTVIPLGAESGSLAANVNRWEQQLGLPPTPEDQISKVVREIKLGDETAYAVDLHAPAKGEQQAMRMLAAILKHGGKTWYFKLAGPDSVVAPEREKFDQYMKSIRFGETGSATPEAAPADGQQQQQLPAGHPPMPGQQPQQQGEGQLPAGHPPLPGQQAGQPPQQGGQLPAGHPPLPGQQQGQQQQEGQLPAGHPPLPGQQPGQGGAAAGQNPAGLTRLGGMTKIAGYDAPAGWESLPPSNLREVSFKVKGDGTAEGQVFASKLRSGSGGTFEQNVQRWQQQVGMPVSASVPDDLGEKVNVAGKEGRLLDFVGPEEASPRMRQLIAMVDRGAYTWFFKIIGPPELVEKEKQAFIKFVGSVRFGEGN